MKRKTDPEVIYYDDELNDDFAGTKIKSCEVTENYKFLHTERLWRVLSFIAYYIIAAPLIWFYERVILRVRFVGKDSLKKCSDTPVFLYGNHTGFIDAFTPNLLSLPKRRNRIIVSPDAVSVKGLRVAVELLGGVPIPTTVRAIPKFKEAIEHYHKRENITVYPEAHIWPYFTGVRKFTDTAFSYPLKYGSPVFAFFTAYTEPKGFLSCFRKANVTVYVSGPIYAEEGLSEREARRDLCEKVYSFMQEASKKSTYAVKVYKAKNEI